MVVAVVVVATRSSSLSEHILPPKKHFKAHSMCQQQETVHKNIKDQVITNLSEHLPHLVLDYVATQTRIGKKQRTRWSDKDKYIALALHHKTPKAYHKVKKISKHFNTTTSSDKGSCLYRL